MKKCLRTGKKALSVFMAVLMVITAMVFAAPQKASAIEAGGYRVTVILWTTNGFDTQDKNGLTLYVNYKKTDAAGTPGQLTYHVNEEWFDTDWGKEVGRDNNHKFTIVDAVIPGFPTSINLPGSKNNDGWARTDGAFDLDIYVNGTFLSTVGARFEYKDSFNPTFIPTADQLPKARTVVWSKNPSDITVPTDSSIVNTTAESYCVDQYGVRLGIEPSYAVTYNPSAPTDGLDVSTASDAAKASVTISADKNALLSGDGNNSRTAIIQTNYNYNGSVPVSTDANPTSKEITISDPKYNVTLLDNGGEIKTQTPLQKYWGDSYGTTPYAINDGYTLVGFYPAEEGPQGPYNDGTGQPKGDPLTKDYVVYKDSSWYPVWRINQYTATFNYKDENYKDATYSEKIYVGSPVTAPDIPTVIEPDEDHTYTFTGWDSEVVSTMPANDVVYTAQYNDEVHYADYTEVVNQINAANEKMKEELFVEGAYTQETVTALDNALKSAVDSNNNKLLKSQQSQVDNIASNLKSAIENLKLRTFTVLFVDESGAIIKDGYYYVNYGDKVEVPTAPEKAFDATYHYEFSKWNSDSNDLSACEKVTDNLKYIAEFNAIEHKFAETVTPSDCSNDGVITRTCDCGYTYTFVNESDKAHHTWSKDYKELIPATCATEGSEALYCTVCGAIDESSIRTIPALTHDWGEWNEEIPATCTGKGMKVRECTRCGGKDVEEIPVAGHKWGETTVVAPTCTNGGYSTHTCSVCDISEIFDLTDATGHSLSTKTTLEPTCVSVGYKETTCANDGCSYNVIEIIPATGEHSYGEPVTIVKANCVSDGIAERECSVCHRIDRIITPRTNEHSFGPWQTKKAPTCGETGSRIRFCTVCGTSEEEVIPATGLHNYVTTKHEPTCVDKGFTVYACKGCGRSYLDNFEPEFGHDYDEGVAIAATCTTAGGMKYTCKRINKSETVVDGEIVTVDVPCGHVKIVEDPNQPATGHNLTDWEYVEHPTVKDAYAKYRHCQNGGCEYYEYEKGAGEGHEAEDGINIYYIVNYYNEWVSDGYETLTQNEITQRPISYTKLTTSYKTEKLASIYVLKGTEAVYPGKTPVRDKDRDNGLYTFEGWTFKGFNHALKHEPDEYESADGLLLNLSSIDNNTDAYALFRSKDAYYNVTFYNADGTQLTRTFNIHHGHSVEGVDKLKPTQAENNQYKFEFSGWSYDYTRVYDNVAIIARYNSIKKNYTLVYHDYDGTVLGKETITYGGSAQNIPAVAEKPEDETYIYKNLDKWTLVDKTTVVNLSNFTSIPKDAKEGDEIHIYAKQEKRFKIYKVQFIVLDPYDQNLSGATVQVLDSRGQLAATATTDEKGVANIEITYSSIYTVKISRGNYAIEGTFTLDPNNPGTIKLAKILEAERSYQSIVKLNDYTDKEMPVDEKCGCVCHTFLSGIWIFTMNLLYKVFKIRHVCCYDMFVVHGDKLDYSSN